ncbi:MAG: hypothetical protein IPM23_05295 [Candidatus Melainabacteria bacterium]|nr:hypothetical protein [Candidatus Melainabacteria bacterium]
MGNIKVSSGDSDSIGAGQDRVVTTDSSESVFADQLEHARQDAHGAAAVQGIDRGAFQAGRRAEGSAVGEDGFAIVGDAELAQADGGEKPAITAGVEVLPSIRKPFDAEKIADNIEAACNEGGIMGLGTDVPQILNNLKGLTPEQIALVDQRFAEKHGVKYAGPGQRWGLREEFRDEMSGATLERALAIVDAKNEVPESLRVAGADTLKPGSELSAGQTNRVTMPDGRIYDVYIPQNAQKPLPVVMMMHGASNGSDMADGRILERESSMNDVAEQYGFAVVYAFSKSHHATALGGVAQEPATWNMQGHKNFLPTDGSYDDGAYLDRVVADVGNRVHVDDTRIGVAGMSDGGRAAEQYVLDRPGKFAALSVMHGTWMNGEEHPKAGTGLPIMLTHGTADYMLPFDQGDSGLLGEKGRGMMSWLASPWIPGTSDSRPKQQFGAFAQANECLGTPSLSEKHDVVTLAYDASQCKNGEVKQYLVDGANHAWQDWRNEGGWYLVGMPDRNQNMSEETAKFILSHRIRRNF